MHRDRRHSTRARVSFVSARRRSALSTSFPPLFAHALFVHTSILATTRGGSERAGASPSTAAAARVSASARAAATAKTRAARALASAASRSALVMIFWVTGVPVFISVTRSRSRSLGVARRDAAFVVDAFAFSFRVFFPASPPRFPSRHPREASMDSHECPSTSTPPIASAASDGGDRSTATVGVISAVTPSQYPGSLRPTRADTSRRCAPARRDAREPKTSPCASARTFRREAREGGSATRGRAVAEASGVARPDMVTARCAGRRALDAARRWRASV